MLALIPVRRGELVRPELAASLGERVEHGERPLDGGDAAYGWLSGSGHGAIVETRFCNAIALEAIVMAENLPSSSPYVVVGAGIHGLSTAYHLAKELRTRGLGSGADVLVLDKSAPGAGASGIACGVVRNNYFQPAMSELMQACVEVWESDPAAYAYNPVGYIALGAAVQEPDLTAVYERQQRIGYRSELILGADAVDEHMRALFPDWRAQGVTVCLHEHQGGFAFNLDSVHGLVGKCASEGVTILSGVEVQELELGADDAVTAVAHERGPDRGRRAARDRAGPVGEALLGDARAADGDRHPHARPGEVVPNRPMWTYWNLQEGEITVDPTMFATADGGAPPVIHLDTDAPLYTDDGDLVTDELWGIYFKRDRHGVQGGASPLVVEARRRARPVPADDQRRPGVRRHVVRGALARDGALRGLPRRSTGTRARAASARSPPTTSRCSTT